MKLKSFSQQGKRSNNEDFTDSNERLWMVCDGVGGHVSGERASRFVVEHMLDQFSNEVPDLDKNRIQASLGSVQTALNKILDTEPELERMGTTFTGIFKTKVYWYAAHIGDSRIYLFRPSEKKLWHTWDHSLVGELMRHHDITREEGRFHPMSNRISKAVIANSEGKIQSASIVKIDELKPGDIFLLCSDGVVEAWGDFELTRLFSDLSLGFEEKCEKLREQCERLSKDNNTALMLEVEKEDAFSFGHNEELEWVTFQEIEEDYQAYKDKQKAEAEEEEADQNVFDVSDLLENTQEDDTASEAPSMNTASKPSSDETAVFPAQSHTSSPAPLAESNENPSRIKSKRLLFVALLLLISALGIGFLLRRGKTDKPSANGKTKTETTKPQSKDDNAVGTRKVNNSTGNETRGNGRNVTGQRAKPAESDAAKQKAEAEAKQKAEAEAKRKAEAEAKLESLSTDAETNQNADKQQVDWNKVNEKQKGNSDEGQKDNGNE